jgi:hypothetical protein
MSVHWNILPVFIQEGVVDFPFSSNADAQEFMDLLVSRSWFTVSSRPDDKCSAEEMVRYLGAITEEWVSELIGSCIGSLD